MKSITLILIAALSATLPGAAQNDTEQRRKIAEIQAKIRNQEPISPEDRAFMQQFQQRQRAEYAKTHPPQDSTGMVPLPDLGKGTYKGEQGGLYPGGENAPPAAHRQAGIKLASGIQPLD